MKHCLHSPILHARYPSSRMGRCHYGGFSLVELLVVIAVIVILIALLLPAISASRASSRIAKCASQLSEIGKALRPAGVQRVMGAHAQWTTALAPYLGDGKVLHCPDHYEQPVAVSYGLNTRADRMSGGDSQRIVALDYKQSQANVVGPLGSDDWPAVVAPRHLGQLNVLYFDNSVRSRRPDAVDPRVCRIYDEAWRPIRDFNLLKPGCTADVSLSSADTTAGGTTQVGTTTSGASTGGTSTSSTTGGTTSSTTGGTTTGGGCTFEGHYDFGTSSSPLAAGYTRVTHATVYAGAFGWQAGAAGLGSLDRSSCSDPLKRDMNYLEQGTFSVAVPNATYSVTVTLGDWTTAREQMGVSLEGIQVDAVDTAAMAPVSKTYSATVFDGTLDLKLEDKEGSSPYVTILGLDIVCVSTSCEGLVAEYRGPATVDFTGPIAFSGLIRTSIIPAAMPTVIPSGPAPAGSPILSRNGASGPSPAAMLLPRFR